MSIPIYDIIYSAVGELFADINNLGIEIFDLSWVQAVIRLFTLLGWTLFAAGVVVAVFEVGIECQTGRVNVRGAFLNVLKGFFAASLVGVLPVQLYKFCCSLQGIFTGELAGIWNRRWKGIMFLPSISWENFCVRENWYPRTLPEDFRYWRNWRRTVQPMQPI